MITEWDIWVRSTDMDSDGVVNNARYFEFFEQARLEHMIELGLIRRPRLPGDDDGRTFTIAETSCRFRAPLRHRDWVRVRCWLSEGRNRSFILSYEILMREENRPRARRFDAGRSHFDHRLAAPRSTVVVMPRKVMFAVLVDSTPPPPAILSVGRQSS